MIDGLGKVWRFPPVTSYKPYPACRMFHGALDCFSYMVEKENLKPAEIASIKVYMESNTVLFKDRRLVETQIDTQFSVPFVFSLVAHRIKPGPQWEDPETYTNRGILKFMDKVSFGTHPRYIQDLAEDPRSRTAKVEVVARGKTFVEERRYPKGSPSPDKTTYMTDEELVAKFRDNASRILPPGKIDEAVDALMNLENVADIREICKLISL